MWWRAIFLLLLAVNGTFARLFSEGGSFQLANNEPAPVVDYAPSENFPGQLYDAEGNNDAAPALDERQLAGIVDELRQMRNADNEQNEFADGSEPQYHPEELRFEDGKSADAKHGLNIEELARLGQDFKNIAENTESQDEVPETVKETDQPLTAMKKGQSEFVEFVEPVHSNKLRNLEIMEKRVPNSQLNGHSHGLNLISSSGNIAFVAFVTMCCVMSVVGVVGGAYYYNNVRKSRDENFDDFTRYSPAGPGRDKLRKNRGGGSGNFAENGDESLAYKAQLHHYQQTKQKIIGAEEGLGGGLSGADMDASDKSDDEGDENNFSVYECPGLAPTGDIEVQNPNFELKH